VDRSDAELAAALVERLDGRQLGCAESLTAGRLATAFASVDGAVDFFRGGLVAYQPEIKASLLEVSTSNVLTLDAAEEMCRGVARLLDVAVAVSTTGLAGGEPEDGVDVGTVFVGTLVDGVVRSARHHFPGDPAEVCAAATHQALRDLFDALCS
jgi:PncC family amidohydrolase